MTLPLDDFSSVPPKSYAQKSWRQFLIATALYFIPILTSQSLSIEAQQLELVETIIALGILSGFVVAIFGFINGIRSFLKREKSLKKYLATLGNLVLVAIMLLASAQNIADLKAFLF